MDYLLGVMDIGKSFHYLLEEELGHVLLEPPPLLDVREQVAARAQLNHKANMLLSLEGVVQFHHMLVVALLQYPHFQFGPALEVFLALQVLLAH